MPPRSGDQSGMSRTSREAHIRFCEGPGVRLPRATRRIRLRSAPTRLLRQPSEEVCHLPRFHVPHGAQAPHGARTSLQYEGKPMAPSVLVQGDLPGTVDFRRVLAEITAKRLGVPATAQVFPGLSALPLGVAWASNG
jgi:hypothetical protein